MRARFLISALFCACAVTGASAAEGPRVALLSEAEVKAASVWLSDLLPPQAPPELVSAAAHVSLGSAPQIGQLRQLTRAEIAEVLADGPQVLGEIEIPASVRVRRSHRQLSREEVAQAISAALGRDGPTPSAPLSFELTTPVNVTTDDPGLRVTEVRFDPAGQETRFRLWTSREPRNLPFYVSVPGRLAKTGSRLETSQAGSGIEPAGAAPVPSVTASRRSSPPIRPKRAEQLVKAGVATQLVIEGADYRITATVIPLQAGALGEEIRVRDPATQKILNAQVAGPALVKGTL